MGYLVVPFINFIIFISTYTLTTIFYFSNGNRYLSTAFLTINFIFTVILISLSPINGGDKLEYSIRFENYNYDYSTEVAFGFVTDVIRILTSHGDTYVVILSILCMVTQIVVCQFVSKNKILVVLLLLANSFSLLTWVGIYRNGLSIPFVLLTFYFIFNKNRFLSFVSILIAILLHNSAIIFLPIYLYILLGFNLNRTFSIIDKVFFVIFSVLVVSYFLDVSPFRDFLRYVTDSYLMSYMPEVLSRPVRYITSDVSAFNDSNAEYLIQTSKVQIEILAHAFVILCIRYFSDNKTPASNSWFLLYSYGLFIYMLFIGVAFSYRFYLASSFFFVVYVAVTMKDKKSAKLSFVMLMLYFVFVFYSLPPEKQGLMYINVIN